VSSYQLLYASDSYYYGIEYDAGPSYSRPDVRDNVQPSSYSTNNQERSQHRPRIKRDRYLGARQQYWQTREEYNYSDGHQNVQYSVQRRFTSPPQAASSAAAYYPRRHQERYQIGQDEQELQVRDVSTHGRHGLRNTPQEVQNAYDRGGGGGYGQMGRQYIVESPGEPPKNQETYGGPSEAYDAELNVCEPQKSESPPRT
jgi:hypothetical protein